MIRALLLTICLAVFPYQGSSVILESGNENDYEVEYPEEVAALAKGGIQDAHPETSEETMEFQLNGEPGENYLAVDRHCFRGHCWVVPKKNRAVHQVSNLHGGVAAPPWQPHARPSRPR